MRSAHRSFVIRMLVLGAGGVALTATTASAWELASLPSRDAAPLAGADARLRIRANDNRRPAGRLRGGVLTLRLEARDGMWYPDGPRGMGRPVAAFAEEGQRLQNPGPLLRVPVGTEVRVTVRNRLNAPLTMFGFGRTRGIAGDSVRIERDAVREMRFTLDAPGTYYYAGKTTPVDVFARRGADSQLNGVIVVDPPGATGRPRDRIFLISWWGLEDTTTASGAALGSTMTINGLSWPHTERFDVHQGDSLHWRWVSMTGPSHPMHLHGVYFRVDGRGDGARYTAYTPEQRRLAVTEFLRSGETMTMAWSPERPGNWLFHCHVARHMTPRSELDRDRRMPPPATHDAHAGQRPAHAHEMSRLVLGIRVKPRGAEAPPPREARPIRLLVRSRAAVYGDYVGYSYVLGDSPEAADSATHRAPGPLLLLEKDQPVAVTVINQSHEPAAVHWHGIELESYPDGVPGWSGSGKSLLPAIPPHDSLTVRFTPPRAGTFMYHSHFNELQQIASGLYGPIVVLERGRRYDPDADRVLLFSDGGPTINTERGPFAPVLLNGQARPQPMEFRPGVAYRLRLINIRSDYPVQVALLHGGRPVEWRQVAKDGADLPPAQAVARPALLTLGTGEIYDFEFTAGARGDLVLRFGFPPGFRPDPTVLVPEPTLVPVRVR